MIKKYPKQSRLNVPDLFRDVIFVDISLIEQLLCDRRDSSRFIR